MVAGSVLYGCATSGQFDHRDRGGSDCYIDRILTSGYEGAYCALIHQLTASETMVAWELKQLECFYICLSCVPGQSKLIHVLPARLDAIAVLQPRVLPHTSVAPLTFAFEQLGDQPDVGIFSSCDSK